jgi:energy-coupling factor transporter transmembrane protein EcfT
MKYMDKALRKTLIGLVILSLALLIAGVLIFRLFFKEYYFWFFPVLILFFLSVNSSFFIFFHKSLEKTHNQFIRNFMASTGVKLVIYFVLILVCMLSSPKTAIPFAVTLSVIYIAYTAYDLLVMLSLIKRRKEISDLSDKLSN